MDGSYRHRVEFMEPTISSAQLQLNGADIGQEALYPFTFEDSKGNPLSGNSSYLIHFDKGQSPPVDGFWSITMYNDKSSLVDNPINRYSIGKYAEGMKNNIDGSLDIYIQNASPGADKESNWLPSAEGTFTMVLRLIYPNQQYSTEHGNYHL